MESKEKSSIYRKGWALLFAFLFIAILAGLILLLFRFRIGGQPVEIVLPPAAPAPEVEVYLSGAVANPGIYSLGEDTTLKEIRERAGGVVAGAGSPRVKIYFPFTDESLQTQKVNLNTAPAWLLEALPGIGETLASRIVDYRTEKGLFSSIEDLKKVPGIGETVFNQVKDLITVVD